MKRARINALVDMVAFAALVLSGFSGVITWKILPSGGGGPRGGQELAHALFLGMERGEWRDIHIVAALVFVGLIVFHLTLHWRWIGCIPKFFSRERPKTCDVPIGDSMPEEGWSSESSGDVG